MPYLVQGRVMKTSPLNRAKMMLYDIVTARPHAACMEFKRFVKLVYPRNPNLGPQLIDELKIYGKTGVQQAVIA
ncbi:MAG: hypothetical protein LQ350_004309 [Teloschistes chrysophthalmus]|nr:MAG: hypothetical protein LQ350_004309 [Niorma chrysophthalma]